MRILGKFGKNKETEISTGIPRDSVPFPDVHAETQYVKIDVANDEVTMTEIDNGDQSRKIVSMPSYGFSANEIANMISNCESVYKAATHFENVAVISPLTPKPNFNFKPVNKYNTNDVNKITENTQLVFKCYDPQDNHLYKEKRTIQETKKYIVSHWLDHTESNIGDGEFESAIGWMEDATKILKMEPSDFLENVLKNNTYNYQPLEDIGLTYFDVFEPTLKIEQIGISLLELTDKNGELMTFPIEKLEKAGVSIEQVKEIIEASETLSEAYFEIVNGKEELSNLAEPSYNNSHDDIEIDL